MMVLRAKQRQLRASNRLEAHAVLQARSQLAQDGSTLVIVEVRTRRGQLFGSAEESVTPGKQARLAALAEAYSASVGWQGPLRIDVVAIALSGDGRLLEIRHIVDAVG
jgi:putative endonuclease